jgi:cell division protein ZapA
MATGNSNMIDISIRGKDYRVSCRPEEREALMTAVRFLDGRMADVADKTRSSGEKLAVMVALNLAHELLAAQASPGERPFEEPGQTGDSGVDGEALQRRIVAIEAKLDEALTEQNALF